MRWYVVVLLIVGWALRQYDWYRKDRRKRDEEAVRQLEQLSAGMTGRIDSLLASLMPPTDVHASEPWDRFWQSQIEHGVAGFTDLFVDDRELLRTAAARGFKTVLCVGSGLSREPHALAAAGLQVTVLDISPLVIDGMSSTTFDAKDFSRIVDESQLRPGGTLQCVAGDLSDPSLCPGPYDLVVERKTLQLFPESERAAAVAAVAARMSPNGVLFSHCHNGAWRPGQPREHLVEPFLERAGFAVGGAGASAAGRTAMTLMTTG